MNRFVGLSLAVASLLAAADAAHAQRPGPRVFVLDQEARTVTAMDVTSGAALRTVTLQGSPSILVRTADGNRLIVLDRGVGRDAGEAGFQAKSKSVATILDANSLEVRSRTELGWGLEPTPMLSPTGDRLAVICPGYVSRKPEETLPREIVTVDLASGQVAGRLALNRLVTAFFSTPDGRTAVLLSARDKPKQTPPLPAALQFIDLVGPKHLETVSLEGNPQTPVLSPDGKFVYLLDRGNASGNPDKNVNGRVYIVSTETRTLHTTSEVGSKPRGFVLDETGRQLLLLSDAPPVRGVSDRDRAGELRLLRGATLVGPIKLAPYPAFIRATSDGGRVFVISDHAASAFALPEFTPLTSVRIPGINAMNPAISPDGRRAFGVWQQNLSTYDLESGKELAKVVTGRMSQRWLLAAVAATATVASKSSARREAENNARSHYMYTEYNLKDANETIAVRPDSKAVYVLNQQTSDVTIVDSETGSVIEKVGVDGFAVRFLPAAGIALVIDHSAVHAIDLATNKKLDDLSTGEFSEAPGFSTAEVSPDGKHAVVYGRKAVLFVNGANGKAKSNMQGFKWVVDIEFDW